MKIDIDIEKIKGKAFKIFWFIARHAFLACLVLFLLAFFFGFLLYNKCNTIVRAENFEGIEEPFLLKGNLYDQLLDNWQKDQERFDQADYKEYSNPFSRTTLTEEEI